MKGIFLTQFREPKVHVGWEGQMLAFLPTCGATMKIVVYLYFVNNRMQLMVLAFQNKSRSLLNTIR